MIDRFGRFVGRLVVVAAVLYFGAHAAIAQTSTAATVGVGIAVVSIAFLVYLVDFDQ